MLSNLTHPVLNTLLAPQTSYFVQTRARNNIAWGPWSDYSCLGDGCSTPCETKPTPVPPFPWLMLLIGLACLLICVTVCAFLIWKSNLSKMLAPRLRNKEKREVIQDFVSSDMTPMEEKDPELVINPIFVHKMKQSREKQRKAKVKKSGGVGKSGGLARLGLNIEAVQKGPPVDPRIKDMYAVDHYLEREKNIVDKNKQLTAVEKEAQQKALLKAQKKGPQSALKGAEDKVKGFADARGFAREATRAGRQALKDEAEGEEDDDDYGGGGGGIRGGGKGNTAVL
jgi:hypothetical protein